MRHEAAEAPLMIAREPEHRVAAGARANGGDLRLVDIRLLEQGIRSRQNILHGQAPQSLLMASFQSCPKPGSPRRLGATTT